MVKLTFISPLISQEEEIPELEIDIDELLELPDEGQRIRLQVQYDFIRLTPSLLGQIYC